MYKNHISASTGLNSHNVYYAPNRLHKRSQAKNTHDTWRGIHHRNSCARTHDGSLTAAILIYFPNGWSFQSLLTATRLLVLGPRPCPLGRWSRNLRAHGRSTSQARLHGGLCRQWGRQWGSTYIDWLLGGLCRQWGRQWGSTSIDWLRGGHGRWWSRKWGRGGVRNARIALILDHTGFVIRLIQKEVASATRFTGYKFAFFGLSTSTDTCAINERPG